MSMQGMAHRTELDSCSLGGALLCWDSDKATDVEPMVLSERGLARP